MDSVTNRCMTPRGGGGGVFWQLPTNIVATSKCLCHCFHGYGCHPEMLSSVYAGESGRTRYIGIGMTVAVFISRPQLGEGEGSTTRTREASGMGRAPCCDKANVKKGSWSPEEDAKLKSYIDQHGTGGNWIALPHKIGIRYTLVFHLRIES
ncbi:hypothetical protein GW17_00025131 [Ensete ventricosum]|nr:hypothetical protein GW17_00025131 [Ensete ventricosum]